MRRSVLATLAAARQARMVNGRPRFGLTREQIRESTRIAMRLAKGRAR